MKEFFHFSLQMTKDIWASKFGPIFVFGWLWAVAGMMWLSPHIPTFLYAVAVMAVHWCAWMAIFSGWRYGRERDCQNLINTAQAARKEFEDVLEQHGFHRIEEQGNVIPMKWKQ